MRKTANFSSPTEKIICDTKDMMPESLRFVDLWRLCARVQSIFPPVQFSHQRWVQNCSNLDRSIYHQDRDNEKFVIDVVIRKKVHHSFRPILTVPKSSMFDTPEAFPTIFHCRIRYEEHLSNCYPKTLSKAQPTGPRIECFHQSNITSWSKSSVRPDLVAVRHSSY